VLSVAQDSEKASRRRKRPAVADREATAYPGTPTGSRSADRCQAGLPSARLDGRASSTRLFRNTDLQMAGQLPSYRSTARRTESSGGGRRHAAGARPLL
jgi:hypothetical protein